VVAKESGVPAPAPREAIDPGGGEGLRVGLGFPNVPEELGELHGETMASDL
jgi:hypothetical protein